MLTQYRDIYEKTKYYKEQIIEKFIERGIYPSDNKVENLLNSIDASTSILDANKAIAGEYFSVADYNKIFESIYKDLTLLYQLYYEICVEDYVKLHAFVESHLTELEDKAKFYKDKAIIETNTTSLGTTIFYKNSNFSKLVSNSNVTYNLGNISVYKNSKLACFFHADNVYGADVIFTFKKGDKIYKISPYNYLYEKLQLESNLKPNVYSYTLDDNQISSALTEIDINTKIDDENKYIILAAKDKVYVKQYGETKQYQVMDRPTRLDSLGFNERTYIDFYTVGANSITFRFNKKPISSNFNIDNYIVNNLKYVQHFFIEAPANFSFDFDIDKGEVYAIKSEGIVKDEKLYFSSIINNETKTFKVLEYPLKEKETYNVTVNVVNTDNTDIDLNYIMIKEALVTDNFD